MSTLWFITFAFKDEDFRDTHKGRSGVLWGIDQVTAEEVEETGQKGRSDGESDEKLTAAGCSRSDVGSVSGKFIIYAKS